MTDIQHKDKIIKIIEMFFPTATIYLFGSYARGDFRDRSDLDIAIDNKTRLPLVERSQIKTMIEALNLIQNVDIVDFQSVPKNIQQNILTEGIVWKN